MSSNTLNDSLTITRALDASIDQVWAAWTEPATLERWFCPNPDLALRAEVDLRVGGAWRMQMGPYVCAGEYTVVDPPHRLVFSYAWQESPQEQTEVVLELRPLPGEAAGTELTLTHRGFLTPESAAGHTEGWEQCLDRLPASLREL